MGAGPGSQGYDDSVRLDRHTRYADERGPGQGIDYSHSCVEQFF